MITNILIFRIYIEKDTELENNIDNVINHNYKQYDTITNSKLFITINRLMHSSKCFYYYIFLMVFSVPHLRLSGLLRLFDDCRIILVSRRVSKLLESNSSWCRQSRKLWCYVTAKEKGVFLKEVYSK